MPKLYDDLKISWEAFWTLVTSRSIGMTMGSIPFSEIAAYISLRKIRDAELQDEIIENVQYLDHLYLEELTSKKDKKEKGDDNGN